MFVSRPRNGSRRAKSAPVRVRIRLTRPAPAPAPDQLFAGVFLPAHPGWPARLGSLALHAILIVLIPQATLLLTPVPGFEWSRYEVKPLNVRVPLYFTAAAPEPVHRSLSRPAPGQAAAEAGARLPAPRVELPRLPARQKAETVLLQPNLPMPNIQLSQMPAMAFWARQQPPALAPPVKPFVTPGRVEEPAAPAELDAPPTLAVPNREPRLSNLNIAALPAVREPALPVPASSTAPVRLPKKFQPPQPQQTGSIDTGQGDRANVISMGALPAPDQIVTVPPVTQAPAFGAGAAPPLAPPAARNTADAGTQSGHGSGSGSGTAPAGTRGAAGGTSPRAASTAPSRAAASAQASASAPASESASASTPQATVEPRQPGLRASAGNPGGVQQAVLAEANAAAAARVPAESPAGVRVVQPRDGRFAFVVSGSSDSYPEARGLLGGKVVYTVSVRVGAPKPWILQYCLPAAVERGLGLRASTTPLEAPYPFVMIRPPVSSPIDVRRLIVHGFVNPAGKFEQLSLVSDVEFPEKQALLASLAQWEFRPASRDGQITAVEVLLIIPREAV